MIRHRQGGNAVPIIGALMLAGCATTQPEKPILTATAVRAMTKACGAVSGTFHRGNRTLPYAHFVFPKDELANADGPTPTMKCLGERLSAYRYLYMSFP